MRYSTKFNKIESVTYSFNELDIQEALMLLVEKSLPGKSKGGDWSFDWDEYGGSLSAKLVQSFATDLPSEIAKDD